MSAHPDAAFSARRQQTRSRLLDAALEVFTADGLQGAAVETICARAGFTRGAFYSNFSSKEQLFLELLEREFERRTQDLSMRARDLEPVLRSSVNCVSRASFAEHVTVFFTPYDMETAWFVLEVEFLLLAMRDPSIAPDHHKLMHRFYASISGAIESVLEAAGRRFVIPIEHALPVVISIYEHALRDAALTGSMTHKSLVQLGDRVSELVFALTEEITPHQTDSDGA